MVAPKYGSPEPFSTGAAQDAASTRNDKRREEILLRLISDANEDRMEGNTLFKDRSFDDALAKYSKAIHTLQKLPKEMASQDMAKALNNRGRVYVKLALMTLAEADASEVLSMASVETASKSAAFLVRYHARVGLGAKREARDDLKWSADLGNMDAQKMLLLPSTKKGRTDGGSQGACSSDGAARTGVAAPSGIGGGGGGSVGGDGTFFAPPGALRPSSASVDASVSAMAAGKRPGADTNVKLRARPDAGAGEELTFGGPRRCSSWGQRPVPDVDGSSPRPSSPQPPRSQEGGNAVSATGVAAAGESAATLAGRVDVAGCAKGPDDGGGANGGGGVCGGRVESGGGSGDARTTGTVLEVSRRRRPRPGSPGKGNVTKVSFTPSVPMTAAEEDTFPAPHPVLTHASVVRCFVSAPMGDGECNGGTIVDCGEAVAAAVAVGGTEIDSVGIASSTGIGDTISDVVVGAGRQGVDFKRELEPGDGARGTPGFRESGGGGARSRAGDDGESRRQGGGRVGGGGGGGGGDKGVGREGETGAPTVGLGEGENEGPPPVKQAQDIRWLVAQAKEEPREGDVWAVVDRQWWLRWQRFTGCEEGAAAGEDVDDTARAATADADAASAAGGGGGGGGAAATAALATAASAAACGEEDSRNVAAAVGVDVGVERGGRRRNELDGGDGSGNGAREGDSSPREGQQANDDNNDNRNGDGRTSGEGVDPSSSRESVVSSATVGVGASPDNSGQSGGAVKGEGEAAGDEMTGCEKGSDSVVTPDSSGETSKAPVLTAARGLGKTREGGGSDCGGGGGGSGSGGDGDSSVVPNGVAGTNGEPKGALAAAAATATAVEAAEAGAEAAAASATASATAVAATSVPPPPRAPHPGPIDNSALVLSAGTPGTVPGSGRRLRLRLVRGYHFVLVPQEAWKALHAWYGGGPALPRSLVPVRDSESGRLVCEPQLYPEFSLLDPELQRSLASSSASVSRGTARPEFQEAPSSSSSLSSSSSPLRSSTFTSSSSSCSSPSSPSSSCSLSSRHQPPPAKQVAGSVDTGVGEGSGDGCGGGSTVTTTTTTTLLNGSIPAAPTHEPPSQPTIEKGEGFVEAKGGEQTGDGVVGGRRESTSRPAGAVAAGAGAAGAIAAAAGQRLCAACGRPARSKCNACFKNSHKVFYCSKECQGAHWRFHKKLCGGSRSDPEAGLAMAKRGKAGLANLGNTCFLSSAVQCLSHVQPLTRHILTNAFLRDLNTTNPLGTGGRLVRAYETVLKDLWFGSGKTVSPAALKSAIAQFAPQFNGFSQQDSQEVLSFLLDGLHEDLNRVLKKPYLVLPDGECGRPDEFIAAQSWEMFKMRDRSVLVDSLYGQFKSTLECPQCGKLSRKFDEFNVMPVELLDGQRLHVMLDFAPLLAPSKTPAAGNNGTRSAATILGGLGAEGRRQRRIGVLLPKGGRVSDLKEELSAMFEIGLDEMVIVVVPVSGQSIYRLLPDSAEVLPFTQGYDITAHQCVPGQRHALVVNRVFYGGGQVTCTDEMVEKFSPADWPRELDSLTRLKWEDKEAPFLVSFPEGISCLRLIKEVWIHTPDFFRLLKERIEQPNFMDALCRTGRVKVSEASNSFAPRFARMDQNQAQKQEELDEENGVIVTSTGRYVPPFENVPAAAVLDCRGTRREGLDFLRLDWRGLMLQNSKYERISEPFAVKDHVSVQETTQRAKRVSLQDCLQKFSVPETLCEDNSWHCGNCKELRQAVKTIQVWSLPEVLILHFKRFSHVGPNRGKVELFVDFPINGLDMSSYCRGETLEGGRPMSALYDLFAVSNHMGDMAHGHYTAYVRDWEGGGMSDKWYVCDDEDCQPVDESRVRTQHAYVLFYRRRPLA